MNNENKLKHSCMLTACVVGILLVAQLLPKMTFFGHEMKPVELFSDLTDYMDEKDAEAKKLLAQQAQQKKKDATPGNYKETWPKGVVPIEDFGNNGDYQKGHSMARFYEALCHVSSLDRPVRIALFGDSFTEGDIMVSSLRTMLQDKFGGRGVGFLDVHHPVDNISVVVQRSGWKSYSCLRENQGKAELWGIDARYSICGGNAWMEISGMQGPLSKELRQDTAEVSTIYYRDKGSVTLTADINGQRCEKMTSGKFGSVATKTVAGKMGRVRWHVNASNGLFYGATMETRKGISLDNFATRGIDGTILRSTSDSTLHDFAKARPYDMLIFSYGLNVMEPGVTHHTAFINRMKETITKYAKAYPDATILILSVPERGTRKNGGIVTMKGVSEMIEEQRQMAQELKCAFWSLYDAEQALGGIGAMVNAKPRLANKDYIHITVEGGKVMAKSMFNTLTTGFNNYKNRKTK